MKIMITGATGMAGAEVVRCAIQDEIVEQITLITRRASDFHHPKIREIIHHDFLDYTSLYNVFRDIDACIWCLGISQSRVSKEAYFNITYNYTVAAAKAMIAANPSITFLFLSGEGADSTEKSRVRFAKVKGQAENALLKLNFRRLYIFRPGGITATHRNAHEVFYKKFEIFMVKLMGFFMPRTVVSTQQLATAMLKVLKDGSDKVIIRHRDIRSL